MKGSKGLGYLGEECCKQEDGVQGVQCREEAHVVGVSGAQEEEQHGLCSMTP